MKLKSILFLIVSSHVFMSCSLDSPVQPVPNVTDIDGNIYHTVIIGKQVWMFENLKVTRYRNGDPIPNVNDSIAWFNLTTGAYCNYNNSADSAKTYGKLYNWYAINDSRNIAPTGWHVPTTEEWTVLTNYLSGESVAGGKLKETGLTHWYTPNTAATDEYCFTALPGGFRDFVGGSFFSINLEGYWWSSTELNPSYARGRSMHCFTSSVRRYILNKSAGISVRCLRD